MTKDEIILAQQARIEQLKRALIIGWSPYYINGIDARKLADDALAFPDDLSALRAHDSELIEKCAATAWMHYADTCKAKGVNQHHFGEWIASDKIRNLAEAIEKGGDK